MVGTSVNLLHKNKPQTQVKDEILSQYLMFFKISDCSSIPFFDVFSNFQVSRSNRRQRDTMITMMVLWGNSERSHFPISRDLHKRLIIPDSRRHWLRACWSKRANTVIGAKPCACSCGWGRGALTQGPAPNRPEIFVLQASFCSWEDALTTTFIWWMQM